MYARDLEFTENARKLITDQLYPLLSVNHISIVGAPEGSPGSQWIQANAHIDAILLLKSGNTVTVEEKIVRRAWSAFALETLSCVERRTPGWIYTTTADWIVYAFLQPHGMDAYIMQFRALQSWFNRVSAAEHYRPVDTKNKNPDYTTRCVLVPILELTRAIRVVKYTLESKP